MNKNNDSLRTQIIEAMQEYKLANYYRADVPESEVFDKAIMPVLEAAMKAGELLLHRATTPQRPVADGIVFWLTSCQQIISGVRQVENTVSRREVLKILYELEESAIVALNDARAIEHRQGANGGSLSGFSLSPRKG